MVKTRLLKWNLHKKLSLIEVRTALEQLGSNQTLWPSESPKFRIRRKVVDLEDVLRSCRRRGIQEPFQWIQSTSLEGTRSSDVEMLTPSTSVDVESDTADSTQIPASEGFDRSGAAHGTSLAAIDTENKDENDMVDLLLRSHELIS
jgi:hypothetical protein